MSKIALDLSKFKHVKSDDDSTTLQHKDGHVLTMAHKALSPEFQKQLSVLSKMAKQDATPEQVEEAKHEKPMASGGDVSHKYAGNPAPANPAQAAPGTSEYKDKTSPEQDKARHAQQDAEDAARRKANPNPEASEDEGYKNYADGGDIPEAVAQPVLEEEPQSQV